MKKDPNITQEDFNKKRELFGVIVFESDQDLDPLTAYLCYEDRWQIELLFDAYKNDECRDCTNVQDDFRCSAQSLSISLLRFSHAACAAARSAPAS